ncbi:MAG: hypothetical protein R3A52_02820 [Polyangiales bacterium]
MQPPPLSGRALRAVVSVVEGPAGAAAYALVKKEALRSPPPSRSRSKRTRASPPASQRPIGPAPYSPPATREGAA